MIEREKLRETFGTSEHGNFFVIDSTGVPHPYMIGAKHVGHAADHFGGSLGRDCIEDGEKKGIRCETRGCTLPYDKHEQALVVKCLAEIKDSEGKAVPELHAYLFRIKDLATELKYVGFVFRGNS